jgi:CRP-like cAMP-binding protein
VVKSKTDGSEKIVASLGPSSLFGELSFLEEGENAKATASVRAADDDVKVIILEGINWLHPFLLVGWYLNCLFVDHPHLAGKFYSYLCSILAVRLNERENQREALEAKK